MPLGPVVAAVKPVTSQVEPDAHVAVGIVPPFLGRVNLPPLANVIELAAPADTKALLVPLCEIMPPLSTTTVALAPRVSAVEPPVMLTVPRTSTSGLVP